MIVKHSTDWPTYLVGAIVLLNLAIFGFVRISPESLNVLAYFPSEAFEKIMDGRFLDVLFDYSTSLFTHQRADHLLYNVIPLYFIGVDIARRKGIPLFLAIYMGGGIFSCFAQTVLGSWITVPAIGASGALAALFGYYLYGVLVHAPADYRRQIWIAPFGLGALLIIFGIVLGKLTLFPMIAFPLIILLFLSGTFYEPRYHQWCLAIVLWLLVNMYDLIMTSAHFYQTGSAHVAHLFGAVAGYGIGYLFNKQRFSQSN